MAKSPRAALTRLATTIASRYYPTSGANSGFYLDGRISGHHEQRTADITLDREDRGFFISVFASLSGSQSADAAQSRIRKALDRIMSDVKQPGRNIDAEINELAECAVHVAGRITLQHEGVSQPYFAGIVVRDSELAAVTMGSGCAYLYRGDVIYPLTSDDYPLDAVDTQGKPVAGMDVYCAGVAGTVRYSNIAQLQLDDCVIVCNKEVMEALGQREILRLLYEAADQADAASMIITEASAKIPGIPMQIMIGFVESITTADRTGRINYNRAQVEGVNHTVPFAPTGAQSRHKPKQQSAGIPAADHQTSAAAPVAAAAYAANQEAPDRAYDEYEEEDFSETFDTGSRGRKTAFYLIIAAVCIASLFAIYNMLFADNDDPESTTSGAGTTTAAETTIEETDTAEPTDTQESSIPADTETDEQPTDQPTTTTETVETAPPETTTQTTTTAAPTDAVDLPVEYTVVAGDSLYSIANRFYGSSDQDYIDLLVAENNIPDEGIITIGDVLTIPARP